MKVINPDTSFLAYQKILKSFQVNQTPLVVWQIDSDTGKRLISKSKLSSFHMESKLMHFELFSGIELNGSLLVYCYAEEEQVIFKTQLHEKNDNNFSLVLPEEMQLLEEVEVTQKKSVDRYSDTVRVKIYSNVNNNLGSKYMMVKSLAQRSPRDKEYLKGEFDVVSIDEEEKMFEGQRQSPRARAKADRWVKIKLASLEESKIFKLFDLSQGGIGFLTYDPNEFPKGAEIHVVGFEEFDLDDPLIGTVVAHRPIDEAQVEWKVGVKFLEGQD